MLNYVKDEASIRYDIHSVQSLYDDDDGGGGGGGDDVDDLYMLRNCLLTYLLTGLA